MSLTSGTCCRLRRRYVWQADFSRRSTAAACVLVSVDRNPMLSSSCRPVQSTTSLSFADAGSEEKGEIDSPYLVRVALG